MKIMQNEEQYKTTQNRGKTRGIAGTILLVLIIGACILVCINTMTDGQLFKDIKMKIVKQQIKTKVESTLSEYEDIIFSMAEYNYKTNPTKEEIKEHMTNMVRFDDIGEELLTYMEFLDKHYKEMGLSEEEITNILYEVTIEIIENGNYDYLIQASGYNKEIIIKKLYDWKNDTDIYYQLNDPDDYNTRESIIDDDQSELDTYYQSEESLDDFMSNDIVDTEDDGSVEREEHPLVEREMKNAEEMLNEALEREAKTQE